MRITLLATGSRGDVQPMMALALGLQKAGHRVCLVTNAIYTSLARSYDLELRPVAWNPIETLHSQPPPLKFERLGHFFSDLKRSWKSSQDILAQSSRDSWQACQDAERLVYCALTPWGSSIAEKLGIPAMAASLHPLTPTRAFPTQMIPRSLGGPLNRASYAWFGQLLWLVMRGPINRFRQEVLGLPGLPLAGGIDHVVRTGQAPLLCNLSPTLIPRPPDWPPDVHMHGCWFLPAPQAWQPPPGLVDFIQSGPAPVYIGFGSMVYKNAPRFGQAVAQAVRQVEARAVLSCGWGGLQLEGGPQADLFLIEDAPHAWLLPQMAAVVHHGGAGTTAAGLLAGCPAVVAPYMQDQPFWAQRLYALGASPKPLPQSRLTARSLAERLEAVLLDERIKERARMAGAQMRQERGLEKAIEVAEAYFG